MLRASSLVVVSLILVAACSSFDSANTPGSGDDAGTTNVPPGTPPPNAGPDASADAEAPTPGIAPPTRPASNAGDGASTAVFAVSSWNFGNATTDAWRSLGYDLDARATTAASLDVCKRYPGAPATNQEDGDLGRDNAYAKLLIPLFAAFSGSVPTTVTSASTTLIAIDKLGSGASYAPLAARLYDGVDLPSAPKFDASDTWPVSAFSVNNGSLATPVASFPTSYVNGNTWVSGDYGDISLSLPVGDKPRRVNLHHAVITMNLDPSRQSATQGVIAGVIATADLSAIVKDAAARVSPSLCSGSTIDSILQTVRQASDILAGGTQDPAQTCDGISVAIGFTAYRAALGAVTTPATLPNPCP